jgi:hypothetical protein
MKRAEATRKQKENRKKKKKKRKKNGLGERARPVFAL